ncbi:zf-HC2 domain-containing protein, partial [Longimicrobium sp.]|uniref:anti-sigma factor family protein n=1 Tax=Longimicrobium sp. TaxID=2029185 RepID=UPI002F95FE9D
MTIELTHDEAREALGAEALGALDGAERERVLAHVAECDACRAELDALREAASLVAHAAPHRPLAPARAADLRSRLLARAAADGASQDDVTIEAPPVPRPVVSDAQVDAGPARPAPSRPDVIPITSARRGRGAMAGWLAAAASLLLLIAAGVYASGLRRQVDALQARATRLEAERTRLAERVQQGEATVASLSGPAVKVIEMAAARPADPTGRMFWDIRTARWTFFAHNLPATRPGREYQLWLVTADRKISAGTFRPGPRGSAVV